MVLMTPMIPCYAPLRVDSLISKKYSVISDRTFEICLSCASAVGKYCSDTGILTYVRLDPTFSLRALQSV